MFIVDQLLQRVFGVYPNKPTGDGGGTPKPDFLNEIASYYQPGPNNVLLNRGKGQVEIAFGGMELHGGQNGTGTYQVIPGNPNSSNSRADINLVA